MVFISISLKFEKDIFDIFTIFFDDDEGNDVYRIENNYKDYYLTTISNFILGVVTL